MQQVYVGMRLHGSPKRIAGGRVPLLFMKSDPLILCTSRVHTLSESPCIMPVSTHAHMRVAAFADNPSARFSSITQTCCAATGLACTGLKLYLFPFVVVVVAGFCLPLSS